MSLKFHWFSPYLELCNLLTLFDSFETWFDVEQINDHAREEIVREEQNKNILSISDNVTEYTTLSSSF